MSKNRSNASLKALLDHGFKVELEQRRVGTIHVTAHPDSGGEPYSVEGSSIGDACAKAWRRYRPESP